MEARLPPHDIAAEEAVIGSLLVDGEAMVQVADFLQHSEFFREKNAWCYEACLALFNRGEAINQITLSHELARRNRLEEVGGSSYLSQLVSTLPTSIYLKHYAQIVHRLAIMRRLIKASYDISALAYQEQPDVEAVLSQAEDILFRLQPRLRGGFIPVRELLGQFLEEAAPEQREGSVPTGFSALDELSGGLQPSDLIILAARTSLGKSSLALNIARNAALGPRKARVGLFSLEMAKEQVVERLLASEADVEARRIRLGQKTEAEEKRIVEATGVLSEALIYVDDTPLLSIVEMRSKARRLHLERGIDLLIVDYLQLMQGNGRGARDNRVQEISEISRALKGLARDLNVPILAISQLSRAPELRTDHRPILSDLRESGSIEQDADVVIFIYREESYWTKEAWERQFPDRSYPRGLAEIIVAKHRHGPTGKVDLRFQARTTRFLDIPVDRKEKLL